MGDRMRNEVQRRQVLDGGGGVAQRQLEFRLVVSSRKERRQVEARTAGRKRAGGKGGMARGRRA
eukprot:2930362-Pleurochrysis_carterae.AAC.1